MKQLKISAKAAALHVLLSVVIISLIVGSLIYWFFPYPFIATDDLARVLKIVIAVDVTLGPLLTFILFKPGKKGLWFDMSIVVILQLSALTYGAHAMYESRPAYLVFYGDSFYLANHRQIDQGALSDKGLAVGAWDRPKIVAAKLPGSNKEQLQLAMQSLSQGKPVQFDSQYFTPFSTLDNKQWLFLALNYKSLSFVPEKYRSEQYVFFHVVSSKPNLYAVVDKNHRKIIDILTEPHHAPRKL